MGRNVNDDALKQKEILKAYPLDPALSFNLPATCVAEGVVNTNRDPRRVALWWPNVEPLYHSQEPPPSLAYAAALAASPSFLGSGRLAGWTPNSPAPYVSFVKRG